MLVYFLTAPGEWNMVMHVHGIYRHVNR